MAVNASELVEANLQAQSTAGEGGVVPDAGVHAVASTAADGGHGEAPYADPAALGLNATAWVALAMVVVLGILVWKKVPAAIGAALDRKIAQVREQLDEASALRAEAEALKAEYEGKLAAAEGEAAEMIERARHQSELIVEEAKANAEALVARRGRIAEEKIAAAELNAIAEVRSKAAVAAAAAAERLIREKHDRSADKAMIDRTIAELGGNA